MLKRAFGKGTQGNGAMIKALYGKGAMMKGTYG